MKTIIFGKNIYFDISKTKISKEKYVEKINKYSEKIICKYIPSNLQSKRDFEKLLLEKFIDYLKKDVNLSVRDSIKKTFVFFEENIELLNCKKGFCSTTLWKVFIFIVYVNFYTDNNNNLKNKIFKKSFIEQISEFDFAFTTLNYCPRLNNVEYLGLKISSFVDFDKNNEIFQETIRNFDLKQMTNILECSKCRNNITIFNKIKNKKKRMKKRRKFMRALKQSSEIHLIGISLKENQEILKIIQKYKNIKVYIKEDMASKEKIKEFYKNPEILETKVFLNKGDIYNE